MRDWVDPLTFAAPQSQLLWVRRWGWFSLTVAASVLSAGRRRKEDRAVKKHISEGVELGLCHGTVSESHCRTDCGGERDIYVQ